MKSALSVRSVLWNFPQKCSCNCLWWSECFLKELKSWRSQKVACNVYLIAIVEANLLLCIWRHILWLIWFSAYRNSKHSLLSPHIKWWGGAQGAPWSSGGNQTASSEGLSGHYFLFYWCLQQFLLSLSPCQGFLILGSHSSTHCYFSFLRAFPTIPSWFVSPISVTCTWDGGFWL